MKKFTTLEEDLINEAAGAQEAFEKSFTEASNKLMQIKVALEDFKEEYQNDPRNWGYSGSMGYINNQLDQILEHLGLNDANREFTANSPGAGEY